MGRLIDSDEIEKKLEEILCEPDYQHTGENWSVGVSLAQSAIYDIPTAYDVEAVVKQIEEKAFPDFEEEYSCNGEQLVWLSDVLEIVRNGGVK